jgi:uncharacterized protein (TIGR02453 family)
MTGFVGFPDGALDFFVELEANNERGWWLANKDRFEADVKEPMRALLEAVAPDGGEFHVFRMNRDVRFSKDKSPYKLAHAGVTEREGGATLYVQLSKAGLFVGGGIYHPARDQLARYRAAVDDERSGPALAAAVATVRKAGVDVGSGEDVLVRAPKGFAPDHPRIDLLRWKGCIASKELGAPAWLHTKRAAAEVAKVWARAEPVFAWLDAHVGPSLEPPPDR